MPVHLLGGGESAPGSIRIGLINNMPDGALKATERQFLALLSSASEGVAVDVALYSLPEVPRCGPARLHIDRYYAGIENLWDARLDGLIVTGAEPRTTDLKEESFWGSLKKVLEWAEYNTQSSVWSCLAAHAAVLHIDGIVRRRLKDKCFGVIPCDRVSDHHLTAGVPAAIHAPHSRWNDMPLKELTGSGYRILTRTNEGAADTFVKSRKSLFLFSQGHPEYEADTLMREYRRDVGRYLKGERDTYPGMPEGYLGGDLVRRLTVFQNIALAGRREDLLLDFPAVCRETQMPNTWRPAAERVYANWLAFLREQKGSGAAARRKSRSQSHHLAAHG